MQVKKERREENIATGREALEKELRRNLITLPDAQWDSFMAEIARRQRLNSAEEMYAAIGYGGLQVSRVLPRIKEEYAKLRAAEEAQKAPAAPVEVQLTRHHATDGVVVEGIDNPPIKFAKCCSPLPGDEIIGFVTRGRGVSVHRADCPNATDLKKDPNRIIDVQWEGSSSKSSIYKVELHIEALDRINLLLDVTSVFSDCGANVLSCSTNTHRDGVVEMRFLFEVNELSKIDYVINNLLSVDGVFDARRMLPGESVRRK